MSLDNLNEGKPQIKINRKMRMWNKYRYMCVGAAGIVALVVLIFVINGMLASPKKDNEGEAVADNTQQSQQGVSPSETMQAGNNSGAASNAASDTVSGEGAGGTSDGKDESQTAPENTQEAKPSGSAKKGEIYTFTATAEEDVDITEADAFDGTVFVGDSVANGISGYGFFDAVVADNNMSTDKADNYVDEIMAYNPQNVVVFLGLNDANYTGRTTAAIVGYLTELTDAIHEKNSSVNVYMVSVLPVTESFEGTCDVRQSTINDINSAMHDNIEAIGANYIDVSACYKDESGFLMEDCTNSGSNIRKPYYGFLLNQIAGALK